MSLFEPVQKGSTPLSLSGADSPAPFPPALSWSHYLTLIRVQDERARAFYEIEAAKESWSVRELERQVASLLFERLAKVLEFLDLQERSAWLERDLEQAIIDRIESFLLEFGKGFCVVARQRRLTLEGDHFYVDLVFYNRLLRCFVLIDLKLGNEDGKWFAAAKDAKLFDEAIALANRTPCSPQTLTRAARDFEEKRPEFAVEAGMAALRWLVDGYGYEITGLDVLNAYSHTMKAAENAGRAEETHKRIHDLVARESFGERSVTKVLGRQLGLS